MHDRMTRRRNQFEVHCRQIVGTESPTSSDLLKIFVITRKILECVPDTTPFKATWLYCNWLLHDRLSKKSSWWALEEMSKVVAECSNDTDKLIGSISNSFGLAQMRKELGELHKQSAYRVELFETYASWKQITATILREIVHSPIEIPINAYFRQCGATEFATRLVDRFGLFAVSRICIIDDAENTGVPGRPEGLYWELRLLSQPGLRLSKTNSVKMTGVFHDHERPDQFLLRD